MSWNAQNYPQAMRALPGDVRAKAIDMANILHEEQGFREEHAVGMAIERARMWAARRHGKELVREDGARRSRRGLERPEHGPSRHETRTPHNTRPPLRRRRRRLDTI